MKEPIQLTGHISITCKVCFGWKSWIAFLFGRKAVISIVIDTENETGRCRVQEPTIIVEPLFQKSKFGLRRPIARDK